jgi:hypothetical protein
MEEKKPLSDIAFLIFELSDHVLSKIFSEKNEFQPSFLRTGSTSWPAWNVLKCLYLCLQHLLEMLAYLHRKDDLYLLIIQIFNVAPNTRFIAS